MRDAPILINLWAPAGVGKSRTAAALFHMMKMKGYRVEAPSEFAKELSYQNNRVALQDPLYVTGVQEHRHWMLIGEVDYIISDSPTGTSLVYIPDNHPLRLPILLVSRAARWAYRCVDIRLTRVGTRPFENYGRVHTEDESKALDPRVDMVLRLVAGHQWPSFPASEFAAKHILDHVEMAVRHGL